MRSLSRKYAYRKSLLRNLATSLILYEKIKTTQAKAKEVKAVVEHLLSQAKKKDLNARRQLLSYLLDENAVKKIFEVLLPRYKNIKSGYIKSYKLGNRLGDNAPIMILQLKAGEYEKPSEGSENAKEENTGKGNKAVKAGPKTNRKDK